MSAVSFIKQTEKFYFIKSVFVLSGLFDVTNFLRSFNEALYCQTLLYILGITVGRNLHLWCRYLLEYLALGTEGLFSYV
jgi:hypothetical protein